MVDITITIASSVLLQADLGCRNLNRFASQPPALNSQFLGNWGFRLLQPNKTVGQELHDCMLYTRRLLRWRVSNEIIRSKIYWSVIIVFYVATMILGIVHWDYVSSIGLIALLLLGIEIIFVPYLAGLLALFLLWYTTFSATSLLDLYAERIRFFRRSNILQIAIITVNTLLFIAANQLMIT
jgi:hypothetical protein